MRKLLIIACLSIGGSYATPVWAASQDAGVMSQYNVPGNAGIASGAVVKKHGKKYHQVCQLKEDGNGNQRRVCKLKRIKR